MGQIEEKLQNIEEETFLARPKQTLYRHISNMLETALNTKKEYVDIIKQKTDDCNALYTFFNKLLIISHDFGKVNPFFQDKLIKGNKQKKGKLKKTLTYHSQLSGLFAWILGTKARDYLVDEDDEDLLFEYNIHLVSVVFAILNHHNLGKLPNSITLTIKKYGTGFTFEDLSEIIKEMNFRYIQGNWIENEILALKKENKNRENTLRLYFKTFFQLDSLPPDIIADTVEQILEMIDTDDLEFIFDEMEELWEEVTQDNRLLILILFYYSFLCDLDEWDAKSHINNSEKHFMNFENESFELKGDIVELYRKNKFQPINEKTKDELLKLKQELWERTEELIKKINNENIISFTYPTGSGKTLSFLNLAFNLREQIVREKGYSPRIIYCLPFISITDQVGETLKEILFGKKVREQNELLTIHHHLAESEWSYLSEKDEKNEFNIKKLKDYIYLWNSNIIVTTFVSFWNSLLGGRKRNLLRFHRIAGSIIILDEIQSIPIKYWQLISTLIHQLVNLLGCKVIIGSATNPKALSKPYDWNKYHGIVTEIKHKQQQSNLDRYSIQYDSERKELQNFAKELSYLIKEKKQKSIMAVFNTKESARLVFDYLKEENPNEPLYFLSSAVTHENRTTIIDKLKQVENKRIVVCTQVIEAGVDVSFDIVIRDLAPLDSIIQVAGRCNRYNREKGIVKVVELVKPGTKNSTYYRMIYDPIMVQETRKILQKYPKIEEKDIQKIIEEYYAELTLLGQKKKTNVGVEEFNSIEIENLCEKFKLIEEMENETLVILENNEEFFEIIKKVDSSKGRSFIMDLRRKTISLTKKQKQLLKDKITDRNKLIIISQEEEGEILGYLKEENDLLYDQNGGLNIPFLYDSPKLRKYL